MSFGVDRASLHVYLSLLLMLAWLSFIEGGCSNGSKLGVQIEGLQGTKMKEDTGLIKGEREIFREFPRL